MDWLTGGLFSVTLRLFSGSHEFLEVLIHGVLVEGCLSGNVAYLNNTDYCRARSEISSDGIAGTSGCISSLNGTDRQL